MHSTEPALRPALQVAVVMRRERVPGAMSRWQTWRWVVADVVPHESGFGTEPRCLRKGPDEQQWLHPDFTVELFRDDAEGYLLNAQTPAPCWFVLWRAGEDGGDGNEALPRPAAVSLSYHDAGRWLDAQETVDQVSAPPEVIEWLRAFAEAHRVDEPRRRQRPQSFRGLQDRFGNPAVVTTDKKTRGGGNAP